jgi:putative phage-type endonuclease
MADFVQGSPEWKRQRCGIVTASRMADLTAKTKSGYGASRSNYMAEKLIERLTGEPQDTYTNAAMQWGTDNEPFARDAYRFYSGETVEETGLIMHPSIKNAGASPDGLVGDKGMLEIKCPNTATHIEFLRTLDIPLKYQLQMSFQMMCAGREWCDFVSFDPRLPEEMRIVVQTYALDEGVTEFLTAEINKFNEELDEMERDLRAKYMEKK